MLADHLRRVRAPGDLTALFQLLGYVPDGGSTEAGWAAVARWKTFRVIATGARDSAAAVRGMARRLAATAQPGLVTAIHGGVLALAAPGIGLPRSTPVLGISLTRPTPLQLQLLGELAPRTGATVLEHAFRVADVLGAEAVGRRFFTAFKGLLERTEASLPAGIAAADRALLALFPLTRVLFLYFVQAKGWLDGRPDFLRRGLDDALAQRRHFHRSVLHPLFFGTLNRPAAERSHGARFGRIPYLNGGLFEPHPLERRHGPAVLPNRLWRDAFDEVFERFRFCVREGEEVDAIAPDMLGRVFEGVMHPVERRASGTYYTPEQLVRELVASTLAEALAAGRGLSHAAARRLLAGHRIEESSAAAARSRLRGLRLLDPAVGSGAFLLGALDVLTDAWTALAPAGRVRRPRLRRRIIRHHLAGVDLNPIAVRLTELRLWLAVVADDPQTDVGRVTPLPNLNGVVRQGDALLDPLSAARAFGIAASTPESARAVFAARRTVFDARGPHRDEALAALRQAELAAARELVTAALERVRAELRDLVGAARGRDLFGRRSGFSAAQRARYLALRSDLRRLRAAERRVAGGTVPFFAFEVHYPEVAQSGGFTAVVGNPPWIRAERLPRTTREVLAARFRWWRASGTRGYRHQPDLAIAFLERALELAAPGGAVGLLLPSKLASAGYAQPARHALVRDASLCCVHRVPDREAAAFGASVYPLALVVRKTPPRRGQRLALDFARSRTVPQATLDRDGPWVLLGESERAALDVLRGSGRPLARVTQPALGAKTGADDLLVGTVIEQGSGISLVRFGAEQIEIESDLLRPAVRGRDVRPFEASPSRRLFWPYDRCGALRPRLPLLAQRYIRSIAARLERRTDYRAGPVWTLFRVRGAAAAHRVAWPDIARHVAAVSLDHQAPEAIPLNTCYVAVTATEWDALAIAAALNSTWIRLLLRASTDEARGGYRRHNARAIGAVPVPDGLDARSPLVALSTRAHEYHDVSQSDLDAAVAAALGLPARVRDTLRAVARDLG
jgi:hypothetical protein